MYKKYTYYVYRYTDLPHNSANVDHQIVCIGQQIYTLECWLVCNSPQTWNKGFLGMSTWQQWEQMNSCLGTDNKYYL